MQILFYGGRTKSSKLISSLRIAFAINIARDVRRTPVITAKMIPLSEVRAACDDVDAVVFDVSP